MLVFDSKALAIVLLRWALADVAAVGISSGRGGTVSSIRRLVHRSNSAAIGSRSTRCGRRRMAGRRQMASPMLLCPPTKRWRR